jgi:hypothetical protein
VCLYFIQEHRTRITVAPSRTMAVGKASRLGFRWRSHETGRCKKFGLRKGARPQCAADGFDRTDALLPVDFEPSDKRHALITAVAIRVSGTTGLMRSRCERMLPLHRIAQIFGPAALASLPGFRFVMVVGVCAGKHNQYASSCDVLH